MGKSDLFEKSFANLLFNQPICGLAKAARLALKYPVTALRWTLRPLRRKPAVASRLPFPTFVALNATNRCNLNCAMCINSGLLNNSPSDSHLPLATVQQLLPEFKRYKPFIYITGGEPLLNPDVFAIISLLSRNRIFTSMCTNGFRLSRYTGQILDSGLEYLSISLDHFDREPHDRGRGVAGVYDHILEGIRALLSLRKATPSNIKINTVIRRDNVACLSQMYDFIEDLGIDEWSLQHFSFLNPVSVARIESFRRQPGMESVALLGHVIDQNAYLSDDEISTLNRELAAVSRKSKTYRTKFSIKPSIHNLYGYYRGQTPSPTSSSCWSVFEVVVITNDSSVTLCAGYKIGSMKAKNATLQALWRSDKARVFQQMARKQRVLPPCFRCCALNYGF